MFSKDAIRPVPCLPLSTVLPKPKMSSALSLTSSSVPQFMAAPHLCLLLFRCNAGQPSTAEYPARHRPERNRTRPLQGKHRFTLNQEIRLKLCKQHPKHRVFSVSAPLNPAMITAPHVQMFPVLQGKKCCSHVPFSGYCILSVLWKGQKRETACLPYLEISGHFMPHGSFRHGSQ